MPRSTTASFLAFRAAGLLAVFAAATAPLRAADIELRYPALERLVSGQLFTQDGRRYVKGAPTAKCQYAYLETPRFSAADPASPNGEPRLKITARFSGRSAMDVFGTCMGLGDSFDLTILATPVERRGVIALDNVQVSTRKDSYYIRRVRQALARSFAKDFKIDIRDQARKLIERPNDGSAFPPELDGFDLTGVHVTPDALVLVVEFRLVVK